LSTFNKVYIFIYSQHCAENREKKKKKKYRADMTRYILYRYLHTARQEFQNFYDDYDHPLRLI